MRWDRCCNMMGFDMEMGVVVFIGVCFVLGSKQKQI